MKNETKKDRIPLTKRAVDEAGILFVDILSNVESAQICLDFFPRLFGDAKKCRRLEKRLEQMLVIFTHAKLALLEVGPVADEDSTDEAAAKKPISVDLLLGYGGRER